MAVPQFGKPIVPKHVLVSVRIENHTGTGINTSRLILEQFTFISPPFKIRRAVNPERAIQGQTVLIRPVSRPVEVKTSVEELKAATVRVNNLPGNIAPGLDIVNGNGLETLRP